MNENIIYSPEALNDPDNLPINKKFVKSYDQIKAQLEKIAVQYKELVKSNCFSDEVNAKLDRLDTIETVLNWMLRDDNTDI